VGLVRLVTEVLQGDQELFARGSVVTGLEAPDPVAGGAAVRDPRIPDIAVRELILSPGEQGVQLGPQPVVVGVAQPQATVERRDAT
jgi:hypothetical protein